VYIYYYQSKTKYRSSNTDILPSLQFILHDRRFVQFRAITRTRKIPP